MFPRERSPRVTSTLPLSALFLPLGAISRQERPLQHDAAPPVPQGIPGSTHAIVGPGAHWKLSHTSPAAHSDESMQNVPSVDAAHIPSVHCMKPQQSSELVHGLPSPWQQRGMNGAGRQTAPLQHSCPGSPPSKHEMLGPRHVEHAPLSQLSVPEHAPVGGGMQHICASVPQPSGTVTHMRIAGSQMRPLSQMLRGLQGSPMPPAVVALPHVPPVQSRPPEHVAPGAQQAWPSSPHSVGA